MTGVRTIIDDADLFQAIDGWKSAMGAVNDNQAKANALFARVEARKPEYLEAKAKYDAAWETGDEDARRCALAEFKPFEDAYNKALKAEPDYEALTSDDEINSLYRALRDAFNRAVQTPAHTFVGVRAKADLIHAFDIAIHDCGGEYDPRDEVQIKRGTWEALLADIRRVIGGEP